MIQDIAPYVYDNHYDADEASVGDEIDLPRLVDYAEPPHDLVFLFRVGEDDFWLACDDKVCEPAGFSYEAVNWLRHAYPQHLLFAAAVGWQLFNWYGDNRFCSRCGGAMQLAPRSREIVCPSCGKIVYPKIQPGVIVGVVDGDSLVLTRYAGRSLKIYALVAEFTEIGESLEGTCRREVMEDLSPVPSRVRKTDRIALFLHPRWRSGHLEEEKGPSRVRRTAWHPR